MITDPLVGHVYMAKRYYNAKRIVWEPWRCTIVGDCPWRCQGVWLLDEREGQACGREFKFVDQKWIQKKIDELTAETARAAAQIINLRHLQT